MSESRLCPHCQVALAATSLLDAGTVEVDVCPQCRGVWFDVGELEAVLDAVRDPEARVDRHLIASLADRNAAPRDVRYIPCPVCRQMMNRCTHGHRSGIVVDRCAPHGVWLDGGELEGLFDWVAAGGHVLDALVTAERRQADISRVQEETHVMILGPLGDDGGVPSPRPRRRPGGWLAGALGDLIARMLR